MRKTTKEVETNMAYRWFLGNGSMIKCLLLYVRDETNLNSILSEFYIFPDLKIV